MENSKKGSEISMAKVDELNSRLSETSGNIETVKDHYKKITRKDRNSVDVMLEIQRYGFHYQNQQQLRQDVADAVHFFKSSRSSYAFIEMLKIKNIIKVCDGKIYLYENEFNYWQVQRNNNEIIAKLKAFLEGVYEIEFKYLEMLGFNINSKISTIIRDIKISENFNISRTKFQNLVKESADWINFKNCCYNIESEAILTKEEDRKELFFDSYIDAELCLDESETDEVELKDVDLKEDCPNFLYYYQTSLNGNFEKLQQFGQHLVYSICTKTPKRKAKQILFMIGGHDLGKSCLVDLVDSYIPEGLREHIAPVNFGNAGSRARLFNVRLNTVHEASAKRSIPISEFNKTVWINSDEAVINGILHKGNYLQLHQIYAGNNFFKISEDYDPKDYLPKINFLVVDGTFREKILDLSEKIVAERDAIITFFLSYGLFELKYKPVGEGKEKIIYLTVYDKLKKDNFNFIELEDALEFKSEIEADYQERILAKKQKKDKKLDTSMFDYSIQQFLTDKVEFYKFEDDFIQDIRKYTLEQSIKLIQAKVPEKYKIHSDALYEKYVNYCYEKNIESYPSSMFKKRFNEILKDYLIIESKLKSGKEIINYKKHYKKILDNEDKLVLMKKFKYKASKDNKIGYIGVQILDD